jgi:hypothetical protein
MQNEYYGKATTYQINETPDDCVMDAKSGDGCQISCDSMAAKSVAMSWLPNLEFGY